MKDKYYVFFDVDGTLLNLKSMFSFKKFYVQQQNQTDGSIWFKVGHAIFDMYMKFHILVGSDRNYINRLYYRWFVGKKPEEINELGKIWYQKVKSEQQNLQVKPAIEALRRHQACGAEIVFVSGSFPEVLEPFAKELDVKYWLSTKLEAKEGKYTGRILPPQTIGAGKADAIRMFLAERSVKPESCFAYGDDFSDIPMLEAIGKPVAVAGDPRLITYARHKSWEILTV